MEEVKLVQLRVRIPRTLKQLMKEYVRRDTHKDLSEFTRDALREKIQRDAPKLYQKQFEETISTNDNNQERKSGR